MSDMGDFQGEWDEIYTGGMDGHWFNEICPPCALVRPYDAPLFFVKHVRLPDEEFFEMFEAVFGCNLLHLWTTMYHWDDEGGYSQPSFGELRDFAEKWERMRNAEACCQLNKEMDKDINGLNVTPITKDINEVLEMCGITADVSTTPLLFP